MINEPIIMKKEAFQAIGVSVTTTNEREASTKGKISELWNRYFQEQMMHHIPNKKTKATFAFYSNYESDETGTYTFTIGTTISSLEDVPENMTTWKYIWQWSKENKRAFTTDFELYDERALDPNHAQLDIYIALA